MESIKGLSVLDGVRLWRSIGISAGLVVAFFFLSFAFPAYTKAFFARLTGADVKYPVRPAFEVRLSGTTRVAKGSSLTVEALLLPEFNFRQMILEVNGKSRELLLMKKKEGGLFRAEIPAVERDLLLRVRGGGRVSEDYFVEAVPPPTLRSLRINIIPPEYCNKPEEKLVEGQGNIRAPEGSELDFTLLSTKPLDAASLQFADGEIKVLSAKGPEARGRFKAIKDDSYTVLLVDSEGFHSGEMPVFEISVIPDKPPSAAFKSPRANKKLLSSGAFRLRCRILDDYGIGSVKLFLRSGNRTETMDVAIKNGARKLNLDEVVPISKLNLTPGEIFSVSLEIRDNKPDPNVILTSGITLKVVREYEMLESLQTFLISAKDVLRKGIRFENGVLASLQGKGSISSMISGHRQLLRELSALCVDIAEAADDFLLNNLGTEEASLLGSIASSLSNAIAVNGTDAASGLTLINGLASPADKDVEGVVQNVRRFQANLELQLRRLARFENFGEIIREIRELIGKEEEIREILKGLIRGR